MNAFVEVAFPVPLLHTFHYRVPEQWCHQVQTGQRVEATLGHRKMKGFIVAITSVCERNDLKEIEKIIDETPVIASDLLDLAQWMAQYYLTSVGEILFAMIPPDLKPPKKEKQKNKEVEPDKELPLVLNAEQEKAFMSIKKKLGEKDFAPHLLFGVTGSGKTEIYLQAVDAVCRQGAGAIVLVPEIALTPQTFQRFEARFGSSVAILHSQMTASQRQRAWWRIKKGEVRVVVGSRSAIFAPVQNLGVIVVDEEHDSSYKQEEDPRYHARDVAVMRAKKSECTVILGSATPSLESFSNAKQGRYSLLMLTQRAGLGQLPQTYLVDMRYDARKHFLFSRLLFEKILERLKSKEQVILFLNRRGSAPAMLCESCGHQLLCAHCDVAMTYHQARQQMMCHYCDAHKPVPRQCPSCAGPLKMMGVGTQRLESEVQQLFRGVRVGRMDTDVAAKKGAVAEVLQQFSSGDIDILVGTQMVAKGLDLHNVTLIGVVYADSGLLIPDFRAAEKTYQLIQQVAGRAGRGERRGEVVIQTYSAENPTLQLALKGHYETFFDTEMQLRKKWNYAPYCKMVEILLRGKQELHVQQAAEQVVDQLRKGLAADKTELLGPAPMAIGRVNEQYRWHILLKTRAVAEVNALLRQILVAHKPRRGVRIFVNVDPISML